MSRRVIPAVGLLSAGLAGAGLEVGVEIPRRNVAEYHRPYVAIWIEAPDQSVAANLAVWYDLQPKRGEAGTTWLKDLRQWWRKIGRDLQMPADGVSGATRPAGSHQLSFKAGQPPLTQLAPGRYSLVVEAAREAGGREIVRVPFEWPVKGSAQAAGQSELGAVSVSVKP